MIGKPGAAHPERHTMVGNPYTPPKSAVADADQRVAIVRPGAVTVGIRGLAVLMAIDFAVAAYTARMVARFVPGSGSLTMFYVAVLGFEAAYVPAVCVLLAAAGRGRHWARVLLALVLALNFARSMWNVRLLSQWPDNLGLFIYLLLPALLLLAASLLFLPGANAWYAAARARRG